MMLKPELALIAEEMGEFFNRRAEGYDAHMKAIGHNKNAYRRAVAPLPQTNEALKILDLGCGTGLELKYLFERIPRAQVSCIDLSGKMLAILSENYQTRVEQLKILRDSYLTWEYPQTEFDAVISVNTMHHLESEAKIELYHKIKHSLKPGSVYIESDFMVDQAMMEQYLASYKRIIAGLPNGRQGGYYHIDIPFTVEVQKGLLIKAGFGEVKVFYENIKPQGSMAVLLAKKAID